MNILPNLKLILQFVNRLLTTIHRLMITTYFDRLR